MKYLILLLLTLSPLAFSQETELNECGMTKTQALEEDVRCFQIIEDSEEGEFDGVYESGWDSDNRIWKTSIKLEDFYEEYEFVQ